MKEERERSGSRFNSPPVRLWSPVMEGHAGVGGEARWPEVAPARSLDRTAMVEEPTTRTSAMKRKGRREKREKKEKEKGKSEGKRIGAWVFNLSPTLRDPQKDLTMSLNTDLKTRKYFI